MLPLVVQLATTTSVVEEIPDVRPLDVVSVWTPVTKVAPFSVAETVNAVVDTTDFT
jgi:hypothetical protein